MFLLLEKSMFMMFLKLNFSTLSWLFWWGSIERNYICCSHHIVHELRSFIKRFWSPNFLDENIWKNTKRGFFFFFLCVFVWLNPLIWALLPYILELESCCFWTWLGTFVSETTFKSGLTILMNIFFISLNCSKLVL